MIGNRAYIILENKFYIYDTENNPGAAMNQISQTTAPAAYQFQDVEISGNFAYVTSMEFANDRPAVLVYDISDDSTPLLLEPIETFPSASGNGAPSGSTMVGDRIYIVTTENGVDDGGVVSLKVNGLRSPAAKIGNIYSKDIKVSNGVSIGETLQVGRSATIGSGGLWVDKGEGVHVDGEVVCKPQFNNESNALLSGIKTEINGAISINSLFGLIIGNSILISDSDLTASGTTQVVGQIITIQDSDFTAGLGTNLITGLNINFSAVTTGGDIVGLDISGEDTNILSGDLEVGGVFKGDFQTGTLFGAPSTSQITPVPGEDVFSSGVFGSSGGLGS